MVSNRGDFRIIADEEDDGRRLDSVVADHIQDCSRTRAVGLIRNGSIKLNNEVVKPSRRIRLGEEIHGQIPSPKSLKIIPEPIELDILYQDTNILVINKPPHLVVHPAPGHETGTLVHGLLYHFPDLFSVGGEIRPGIVHRLDKDTSGCLVVALNDGAHQELSHQFKTRMVYKEYIALARGRLAEDSGVTDQPIGRHPVDRKKMALNGILARTARTDWQVMARYSSATLVKLVLKTGRTHQIRVHLNAMGHSIVGDTVYGPRRSEATLAITNEVHLPIGRQMLHARVLGFTHPLSGERLHFEAPLPEDMVAIIDAFERHAGLTAVD